MNAWNSLLNFIFKKDFIKYEQLSCFPCISSPLWDFKVYADCLFMGIFH